MRGSPQERFDAAYIPEPNSGCWLWLRVLNKKDDGYGTLRLNGICQSAHRVSWVLHRGTIPEGLWVLHRCDVPSCVNPDHLFLGTHQDNVDDKMRKGRHAQKARSHCIRGHPFSHESHGRRHCRTCRAAEARSRRASHKQEAINV